MNRNSSKNWSDSLRHTAWLQGSAQPPLFLRQEPFTRPNVRIRGFMIKPRNLQQTTVAFVSFILVLASDSLCQIDEVGQTMRLVIRGRQAADSSINLQATDAARQILQSPGHAFDAAAPGQS